MTMRCVRLAVVLFCHAALYASARAQSNATQGTIRGRVLDETTSTAIEDVTVEFMDGATRVRGTAVTDADGSFVLSGMPRGPFRLRATRLGYAHTVTPYWRVEAGEILTVTIRLHPDAVLLAPLEINARVQSESPVLAGFYHRLDRGMGGTFITREEIERSNAGLVTDLLRMVPGVQIRSGSTIQSRVVSMSRAFNACPAQVWVDGMLVSRPGTGEAVIDELAPPGLLEGIEIHRGLGSVPPEFLGPGARCGVIALWTRRGG
jgi:hypothetical protein